MQTIHSVVEIQQFAKSCGQQNKSIALVPTMGGLHKGHLSLVERAKKIADMVVVSIFVNPTQFGQNEDLATYPDTLAQDRRLLADDPVDVIFAPSVNEMYPLADGFSIVAPSIANKFCGNSRPVFFHGVSLAVLKLLLMVKPDYAIFGQKDYQQLHIIKQLVKEFYLSTQIIDNPTIRKKNGLALSTRNQYLDHKQHQIAPILYQVLLSVRQAVRQKNQSLAVIRQIAIKELSQYFEVDYLVIVQADSLEALEKPTQNMRLMCAVVLGKIRLIDNIQL